MSSEVLPEVHAEEKSDLVRDFIEDCNMRGMTEHALESYRSNLKIFCEFLDQREFNIFRVSNDELREFLQFLRGRDLLYKTIASYFSTLSSFYDYLAFEKYIGYNPVLPVRKRYLRQYKSQCYGGIGGEGRKLITIDQMAALVSSVLDARDKAILTLLAKTGIRRNELVNIDVDDVNWQDHSIRLKPFAKRSNRTIFFDDECARVLRSWIKVRERTNTKNKALFVSRNGNRIDRNSVYHAVTFPAENLGIHNPKSDKPEERFTPHCCRHWFTTYLLRSGMQREYVKELRGDTRGEAIDIYHHIDREELRKAYLAHIPQLGL